LTWIKGRAGGAEFNLFVQQMAPDSVERDAKAGSAQEGVVTEARLARSHVLDPQGASDPCATCEARQLSVCNAIDDADLTRLAAIAVVTEVPGGQCFIDEGEPASSFFNITAGTAKLFKLLPDGRRQITGFVGPGHFLGLAVSDTYAFSAEAIERVRYCRFQRSRLRALLDDFPLMEKRLLEVASNELVAAQEQMLLLGRKTARERLASFLLMQSRQGMPCGHPRRRFILPMTRSDIADYIGLTIETVSRTLTRLRTEGLIDFAAQSEVLICRPIALEGLAGGLR
jgi:CRP/FNR family transcriptional regulator, anaerobic regulatory protein